MLAQTSYAPLAGVPALLVTGQVVRVGADSFLWADGIDMQDPVLLPIPPSDTNTTIFLDTISHYFEVNQQWILPILEAANDIEMVLSPTMVARAVEILKEDGTLDAADALNVALEWSEVLIDLARMSNE